MLEKEIQKQILQYLALSGVFHYRNNTGGFRDYRNHFYQFGTLGSPDIVCVIKGKYIGIEVKCKKNKQSDHQKAFQESLEKAGGEYFLCYSLDDAREVIDKKLR